MSWTGGCVFAAAALALGQALQVNNGFFNRIAFIWLLASLAIATAGVFLAGSNPRIEASSRRALPLLLLAGVLLQIAQLLMARPLMYAPILRGIDDRTLALSVPLLGALSALVAVAGHRIRLVAFTAFVLVHAGLGVWVLRTVPHPRIDVVTVHREAIDALASGRSPYSINFTDIYGGDRSKYYAEGMTADGRVLFGLPYPPLTLAFAAPAQWLLGDFRFAEVFALCAAAVLIASLGWTRHAMLSAIALLTTPRVLFELEQGWTEPYGVLLLALTVALLWRSSCASPIAWGLTMAIKQYLATMLVLTPLLPRRPGVTTPSVIIRAVTTAAAVTLPFAIWDPQGFFRSVVWLQVLEPFRTDSLSALAALAKRGVPLPTIATTLVAGAVAVALALWKLPRSSGGFAAGTALLMFVLFAFGKKAFCNYYFFVLGALAIAVAASGEHIPMTSSGQSPIDRTRV
jgi:hypothetical protein